MVTETSLLAYEEVLKNLGSRQQEVYFAIKTLKEADNLSISKYLNIPINSITPRVNELRKLGLVICSRVGKSITNREVMFWSIK